MESAIFLLQLNRCLESMDTAIERLMDILLKNEEKYLQIK